MLLLRFPTLRHFVVWNEVASAGVRRRAHARRVSTHITVPACPMPHAPCLKFYPQSSMPHSPRPLPRARRPPPPQTAPAIQRTTYSPTHRATHSRSLTTATRRPQWMDMSPAIPNRAGPNGSFPLTEAQFGLWVGKYANLIRRTSRAADRAGLQNSTMVWSSNDRLWERPVQQTGDVLHSGVRPFLDRLWTALQHDDVVFGTAVHPYDGGNPYATAEFAPGHHPQAYGNLGIIWGPFLDLDCAVTVL